MIRKINQVKVLMNQTFIESEIYFNQHILHIKKARNESKEYYLIPSFIDLHTHGGYGVDFNKLDHYSKHAINYYVKNTLKEGVQGVMITTATDSLPHLKKLAKIIKKLVETNHFFLGWHLEGPFINKSKKGAQEEKYIQPINEKFLQYLLSLNCAFPIMITFAPEVANNLEIAFKYQKNFLWSIGHCAPNYEEISKANLLGFNKYTHLGNGMPEFSHKYRAASIVNNVLLKPYSNCEIITDLFHVNAQTLTLLTQRIHYQHQFIISDSLPPKGLSDGQYFLNNLKIFKKGSVCYLEDQKTLAGSCSKYEQLFLNYLKITGKLINAVYASSINAMNYLNLNHNNFFVQDFANFLIINNKGQIQKIYYQGKRIK